MWIDTRNYLKHWAHVQTDIQNHIKHRAHVWMDTLNYLKHRTVWMDTLNHFKHQVCVWRDTLNHLKYWAHVWTDAQNHQTLGQRADIQNHFKHRAHLWMDTLNHFIHRATCGRTPTTISDTRLTCKGYPKPCKRPGSRADTQNRLHTLFFYRSYDAQFAFWCKLLF
jgi:hypothetical protein